MTQTVDHCLFSLTAVDELRVLLADNPIDILALNETWLDTSIRDNDVFISGYEIVRRDRSVRGADGKMY